MFIVAIFLTCQTVEKHRIDPLHPVLKDTWSEMHPKEDTKILLYDLGLIAYGSFLPQEMVSYINKLKSGATIGSVI